MIASGNLFSQGPFPPAAGQEGSTAIPYNSSKFVCWSTGIQLSRGYTDISNPVVRTSFGYPAIALGQAVPSSMDVVSLGDAGEALLTFDRPIVNGPSYDFAVFENGFSDTFLELGFVEVSSDGIHFVRFPSVSLTQESPQVDGFGSLDPTNLNNLAGKYRQGYGTPFDLEELKDSVNLDVNNIRFVKIIDVVGCVQDQYARYDSQGHKINDPWPTDFYSGGFDLDAVGVINAGISYEISNFNDLILADSSYWNGSDGSGSFNSGIMNYVNSYDMSYGMWSGFAYSNMTDNTTAGYTNQFSAYTRGGMDAGEDGGTNYGIAYVPTDWASGSNDPIPVATNFNDNKAHYVNGCYVTNSTYVFLSMRDGDGFAKKFGGESGNDPDWFKLCVYGIDSLGNNTDTLEFYLADFRFSDNSLDYIVDSWRWFDLHSLGKVTGLRFFLLSSDTGNSGINTPTYFCLDNFYFDMNNYEGIDPIDNNNCSITVYPNPSNGVFNVKTSENDIIEVFNMQGQLIYKVTSNNNISHVDLTNQAAGVYCFRILNGVSSQSKLVIKK